jgi:phage head maturation protease
MPEQKLTDILFRGRFGPEAIALSTPELDDDEERAAGGDSAGGTTLAGVFSRFDAWYPIDSWIEGQFMERTVKGAFRKTIKENRDSMVVAFDHGYDPQIGDKPLGPIEVLRETDEGPYYEVPLLDTDYNRDFVLPALQGRTMDGRQFGSLLGASFRMRVTRDEWVMEPKPSEYNPQGWPERTIRETRTFEFGPVVYPASPAASAGTRGLTDWYHDRHRARSGGPRSSTPAGLATGDEGNATPPVLGHLVDPTRSATAYLALVAQARRSTR